MFRRIVLALIFLSSYSFSMSASLVQNATKEKLGCIKGLGVKRVNSIVSYRKTDTIDILEELLNIRGIGKGILNNIKNDTHKKVCTSFSKEVEKKKGNKKKDIKAE